MQRNSPITILALIAALSAATLQAAESPRATLLEQGGVRIKDLTFLQGARDNQLVGFGLVIGLQNTGDKDTIYSKQSMANLLQKYGLTVPAAAVSSKNIAAVMIVCDIPPFVKNGSRIDVLVSAIGDATSLTGGVLVQTPLIGADNRVYAVAQGPVSNNALTAGTDNATVTKNHPTVGQVVGGALVEKEIPVTLVRDNFVDIVLREPDFTVTARMAEAINRKFVQSSRAIDGNTVRVQLPTLYQASPIDFIAQVQSIEVTPDSKARVIINERTGTIVATARVRVSSCAIAHGNIVVTIAKSADVSQPSPASTGGSTVVIPADTVTVSEEGGSTRRLTPFREMPTVEQVATSLNALGVSPRDMMAIFQALKQAGALQAELIIR